MYKRKIESRLQAWLDEPSHKPVVVKGVRQCGKTSSVSTTALRWIICSFQFFFVISRTEDELMLDLFQVLKFFCFKIIK